MEIIKKIIEGSQVVLKGKQEQIELVLCNILAAGHTLIEDSPGVGKTTLVKYIGKSFGLDISRIQFTNDLLPVDILGTPIFNKNTNSFEFHKGPIFGELILADELNRAPAKTQSALLQAMEERFVSIEGESYKLPKHFCVIATQNPHMQIGTFNLPESQLDRFSMKIKMGYPDREATLDLLRMQSEPEGLESVTPLMDTIQLAEIQRHIQKIHIEDKILELIYSLVHCSRTNNDYVPLSNRCAIDLVSVSKSWAYIKDRDYVIPDDIFHLFPYIAGHRLVHPENSDISYEHKVSNDILSHI